MWTERSIGGDGSEPPAKPEGDNGEPPAKPGE